MLLTLAHKVAGWLTDWRAGWLRDTTLDWSVHFGTKQYYYYFGVRNILSLEIRYKGQRPRQNKYKSNRSNSIQSNANKTQPSWRFSFNRFKNWMERITSNDYTNEKKKIKTNQASEQHRCQHQHQKHNTRFSANEHTIAQHCARARAHMKCLYSCHY